MVVSRLDKSISYPEIKSIMADDKERDAELYLIEVHDQDIVVAIGGEINTYRSKHIVYHPIYMIKSNGKAAQIGVYEITDTDIISMTDDNGNLDIERLDEPLIYTFANKSYIEKNKMIPPNEKSQKESYEEKIDELNQEVEDEVQEEETISKSSDKTGSVFNIPSNRSDIFSLDVNAKPPVELQEETSKDAEHEHNTFKGSVPKSALWIQKAMLNLHYNIIETENNSDSFFESIRLSFAQLGQITTVSSLRKKLSREVDQELFDKYTQLYRDSAQTVLSEQKSAKLLEQEYNKYKKLVTETISSNEQNDYIQNARSISKQHASAISQKRNAQDIYNEVKFMKGIDTIDKLVTIVQSSEYYPDEWAISTMERILNIKFIILSSEYAKQDKNNILQCGSRIDQRLQSNGVFEPEFYILLENTGKHYRVITYKNKYIFSYKELPYDIKDMVITKCIERNSGPFVLIPDFKILVETIDANALKGNEQVVSLDMLTSTDPSVVFQFYEKSVDKPAGKGTGEKIEPAERRLEFAKLSPKGEYPDWRRKLDNTWVDTENTIMLDEVHWNSVEHYVQANKFKINHPDFYHKFTVESGSELSKDVDMALGAGSKNGKKGKEKIRPDNVSIDPTYPGKNEDIARVKAMTYKFTEIPHYKGLLIATKNATLNKYVRGYPPSLDTDLIKIRNSII